MVTREHQRSASLKMEQAGGGGGGGGGDEEDVEAGKPGSLGSLDRCSSELPPATPPRRRRSRFQVQGWLRSCRRMVWSHPMVVVTPLVVLGALLAVGIVGVIILSDAIENQRKDDAVNEAVARGIVIGEKMQMASVPVHGLANFVLSTPGYFWPTIQQDFNTTAQSLIDLLAGSGVDTQISVAMAPAAIVLAILPYSSTAIHRDLLADTSQRDSALVAIRTRQLTLSGPSYLRPGWLGVSVRLPVFVNGSYGPDETFGIPLNTVAPYGNTPYNCTDCFGDSRFWGFCTSILDWDAIRTSTQIDDLYRESGYRFQLSRPAQGTETSDFVMAASPDMQNTSFHGDEYMEVPFQVLTSYWTLRLYREGGWSPSWKAPMIVVVVIVALVLSLLIGLVLGWNCRLMETTTRLEVTARKLQHEKERMDALLVRQYDLIQCFAKVNAPEDSSSDLLGLKIDRLRSTLHSRRLPSSFKPLEGDRIELHELLGSGSFGKVYRGTWRGTTVAVKCIVLPSNMSRSAHAERMALMETAISSSMHHPHLVQTYTYSIKPIKDSSMTEHSDLLLMGPVDSWTGTSPAAGAPPRPDPNNPQWSAAPGFDCPKDVHSFEIQLVLEYCDGGSLDEILKAGGFHNSGGLNFGGILDTAADVAKGMLHLHMNEILHSDLKAGNVMFKAGGHDGRGVIAKVVDFGLSIQLDVSGNQTHVSKMFQGTLTHMAPEVLLLGKQSKAADVYAFGILLFELYTATSPYIGIASALLGHHVAREGRRPQFTCFTPMAYRTLAERCWEANPDLRPSFNEILDQLLALRAAYPLSHPIHFPPKAPPPYSPRHSQPMTPPASTPTPPARAPHRPPSVADALPCPHLPPSSSGGGGRGEGLFNPTGLTLDSSLGEDGEEGESMIVLTDFRPRKTSLLGSCSLLPIPEYNEKGLDTEPETPLCSDCNALSREQASGAQGGAEAPPLGSGCSAISEEQALDFGCSMGASGLQGAWSGFEGGALGSESLVLEVGPEEGCM